MTRTKKRSPEELRRLKAKAKAFDESSVSTAGWDSVTPPRLDETEAISLRLPKLSLSIIKEFAARENIGYQVLIKGWIEASITLEQHLFHQAKLAESRGLPDAKPVPMPRVDADGAHHYDF